MTKYILLISIAFQLSCTKGEFYTDTELMEYVNQVETAINSDIYIDNYAILFDDIEPLDGDVNGICRYNEHGSIGIYINRTNWNNLIEGAKLAVMLHEMIHCSLEMGHVDESIEDRRMMSRYTSDSYACYLDLGLRGCLDETIDLYNRGFITDRTDPNSQHDHIH